MRLTFLGAAGTVTGSKYLLESSQTRILIDCGLYQGVKSRRNRNWRQSAPAPDRLDGVILTHAHIDHSGLLPALVRDGFKGSIHATPPTIDLCKILLIPSFAVGRTQTLLYCLHRIFREKRAPRVPVYVNSPMATSVTDLFRRSASEHRLDPQQSEAVCRVAEFVRSVDESRELGSRREPMVVISASGMATGGRILHHLKALAPNPRNTILLPGFQAPGTRGDALVRGVDTLKMHGVRVPVHAQVRQLDILSAHADQAGLIDWLAAAERAPQQVFVTHGEPVPADTIRQLTQERLGLEAMVPDLGDTVDLGKSSSQSQSCRRGNRRKRSAVPEST